MDTFYENIDSDVFIKDLNDKDNCIILFDKDDVIRGFSTQKLIKLRVGNKDVNGVFSGDTIIHKDYWGSLELHTVFGGKYVKSASNYDEFYWFLISKEYKTYRILSSFFVHFIRYTQIIRLQKSKK